MPQDDRRGGASPPVVTRRRFLINAARGTTAGVASATAAAVLRAEGAAGDAPRSRVIIVSHPSALITGGKADPAVMTRMLEVGVKTLTGKQTDKEAWQAIAQPEQRVTMKWNEMGGKLIQTHAALRAAAADALTAHGGIEASKVVQYSCADAKGKANFFVKVTLPTRGRAAGLRRLFTDYTDCLINMPVLKVHNSVGTCIALKNHFGSICNPSHFHGWQTGEMGKSIVELNALPAIKDKTRLVICDALWPQWDLGPIHAPGRRWKMNALIFSTDPLAVETVGTDLLEQKRKTISQLRRGWALPYAHKMIAYGQEKRLGVGDLNRIDVERVDLKA